MEMLCEVRTQKHEAGRGDAMLDVVICCLMGLQGGRSAVVYEEKYTCGFPDFSLMFRAPLGAMLSG